MYTSSWFINQALYGGNKQIFDEFYAPILALYVPDLPPFIPGHPTVYGILCPVRTSHGNHLYPCRTARLNEPALPFVRL